MPTGWSMFPANARGTGADIGRRPFQELAKSSPPTRRNPDCSMPMASCQQTGAKPGFHPGNWVTDMRRDYSSARTSSMLLIGRDYDIHSIMAGPGTFAVMRLGGHHPPMLAPPLIRPMMNGSF